MQTSSFAISLSAFLVWISPVFLFPCFLQNHLSSAITTCVIPHPPSCLSTVCRLPAVDPVHWLCFHAIKDFTLSLLWQMLACLAFLLEEPLWPDPSWVTILTFSHPRIVEKHHFLASFPQNHCAQEIGSWSSFPSFSFKLFKRTYESASTYSSQALCVLIIISLQLQLIECLCRISPSDCKPKERYLSS